MSFNFSASGIAKIVIRPGMSEPSCRWIDIDDGKGGIVSFLITGANGQPPEIKVIEPTNIVPGER